jgi:hypothetical protein
VSEQVVPHIEPLTANIGYATTFRHIECYYGVWAPHPRLVAHGYQQHVADPPLVTTASGRRLLVGRQSVASAASLLKLARLACKAHDRRSQQISIPSVALAPTSGSVVYHSPLVSMNDDHELSLLALAYETSPDVITSGIEYTPRAVFEPHSRTPAEDTTSTPCEHPP